MAIGSILENAIADVTCERTLKSQVTYLLIAVSMRFLVTVIEILNSVGFQKWFKIKIWVLLGNLDFHFWEKNFSPAQSKLGFIYIRAKAKFFFDLCRCCCHFNVNSKLDSI